MDLREQETDTGSFFTVFDDEPGLGGRGPRLAFLLALVAVPLAALIDAALGLFRPGPSLDGSAPTGAYFLSALAGGATAGALLGLVQAGLTGLAQRASKSWRRPGLSVLLFALLVVMNRTLFAGGGVSQSSLLPLLVGGAVACAAVASWVGAGLLLRGLHALPSLPLGIALGLGGGIVLCVNVKLFPNHYVFIHQQEVLVAVGLFQLSLFHLVREGSLDPSLRWRDTAIVTCAIALLVVPPLVGGATRGYTVGRAALAQRAVGNRVLFLGLLGRGRTVRADQGLLDLLLTRDLDGDRRELDRHVPDRRSFNLVMVALDTVRADAVGFGQGPKGLTPVLDDLARDSVVFERAYTAYPTSNFAYSSVMTGLHPRASRARDPEGRRGFEFPPGTDLAAALTGAGLRTVAITAFNARSASNPLWFGHLREGFQIYNPDQGNENAIAREIVDSAVRQVPAASGSRFFLWTHMLDPHAPYEAEPPPGLSGLKGAYLGEVALCDRELGRLFQHLRAKGAWDRTIVVVFSDHGEEFGEHGGRYHDSNVYEPQTHVPLLVRVPGLSPQRHAGPVSLVDLLPTLLELLDIPDGVVRTGRSLVPHLLGRPIPDGGFAYAEHFPHRGGGKSPVVRALWLGPHKLIRDLDLDSTEIYDITKDPAERTNLAASDTGRDERLLAVMAALDERIDRYHAGTHATVENTSAGFRARSEELLARVLSGEGDTPLAVDEFLRHLFSNLGSPRAASLAAHGADGLEAMLLRLLRNMRSMNVLAFHRFARVLSMSDWPKVRVELRKLYETEQAGRLGLALALATLGDPTGIATLKEAYQVQDAAGRNLAAIALARLGDHSGINWIFHNLRTGQVDVFAATLRAVPALGIPNATPFWAGRFRYETAFPAEVGLAALDALTKDSSLASTDLLLRLAHDASAVVRDRARALLPSRLPPRVLDTELQASAIELEGDGALRGHRYALAARRYQECLELTTLFRPDVRFALAHALRLDRRPDAALTVLSKVAEAAPDARDRNCAQRSLKDTQGVVRLDPARFSATLRIVSEPRVVRPGMDFLIAVEVTNTGSETWTGGPALFGCALRVGFAAQDGTLVDPDSAPIAWLAEEGIAPGETKGLEVPGRAPAGHGPHRLLVTFWQEWLSLGERAVLARSDTIYRF